jgi:hypothetical protein
MPGAIPALRDTAMDSDETHVLPKREKTAENVFEFGDRTIMQMRGQDFEIGEEYGTVILPPGSNKTEEPAPEAAAAAPAVSDDPMVRLEQKLDAAMRMIAVMQHKLESLDATLARLLTR